MQILIVNLRHRNIKPVAKPVFQAPDNMPLFC